MTGLKDMNAYGLPEGWRAHTGKRTGAPARRVATNGAQDRGYEAWSNFDGIAPSQLKQLALDAMLFGDAWVDSEGRRVDPAVVFAFEERS